MIGGLRNGTTYRIAIKAANANYFSLGASPASNVVSATPILLIPAAATVTSVVPANGRVSVAVSVAGGGGTPTSFQYSVDGGINWRNYTGSGMSAAGGIATLTGLANDQLLNHSSAGSMVQAPALPRPASPSPPPRPRRCSYRSIRCG